MPQRVVLRMPDRSKLPPSVTRLLVPAAVVLLLAIFWKPQHEILWDGSWVLKYCMDSESRNDSNCIGQYRFSIANTGKHAEHLKVEWPAGLRGWSAEGQVLNLSADFRRANDPDYRCDWTVENTGCSIENLSPGALLIITMHCRLCGSSDLELLDQQTPILVSDARTYRSDPRSTYLFRRLGFFLSLLTG